MIEFLNKDDERMRLDRTICRWNDDNVFVKCDYDLGLNTVYAKRLKRGSRTIEVDCSDPRFDTRAPCLGWYESAGGVYWMVRSPRRQYKMGLPVKNVVMVTRIGGGRADEMHMPEHWVVSSDMDKALKGYDRSVEEAIDTVLNNHTQEAVLNEDFAIRIRDGAVLELFYCGRFVGYIEGGQPRLFNGPDASFILRALHRVKGY